MQLTGRKRWQLYRPTFDLPLAGQTSKDCKADCPPEPVLDVILETGDILYIPRGWWHCATPVGEPTFHVAVGVHPASIKDYFSWVCEEKLPELLSCRRSLGFDHGNAELVRAAAREALAMLEAPAYLEEYLGLIANSDRVQSPFKLDDALGNGAQLASDTVVRLNTVYPRQSEHADSLRKLVVNGAALELPEDEGGAGAAGAAGWGPRRRAAGRPGRRRCGASGAPPDGARCGAAANGCALTDRYATFSQGGQ
jgi:hypothetical protein